MVKAICEVVRLSADIVTTSGGSSAGPACPTDGGSVCPGDD